MEKVTIVQYTADKTDVLKQYYPDLSAETSEEMASGYKNGHFSRFFLVYADGELVGTVSLYQHSGYIVSAGPEIFPQFRRRGYAYEAMRQAYDYAKEHGFLLAQAQIRTDNEASIRLHEKLGFLRSWEDLTNRRGNKVYMYSKIL